MSGNRTQSSRQHIVTELGFGIRRVGDELHGDGSISPEMHVPGTTHLRASVLATWTDILTGLLAALVMGPRVPVTLDLDVHLYGPAPADGPVRAVGRTAKNGRSVFVAEVEFTTGDGTPIAIGAGSFMYAPDQTMRLPANLSIDMPTNGVQLSMPFAERAGCERREPGVAVLAPSSDGLNASNTVNGGLIALAAEEAVLSTTPGSTLSSLALRYLSAARLGPVVATAQVLQGLGRVQVRDAGNADRLCVMATTRIFPAAP